MPLLCRICEGVLFYVIMKLRLAGLDHAAACFYVDKV